MMVSGADQAGTKKATLEAIKAPRNSECVITLVIAARLVARTFHGLSMGRNVMFATHDVRAAD
jgi:hypothetical protein